MEVKSQIVQSKWHHLILAAVVAGWYLIAPTFNGDDNDSLNTYAPLSQWEIIKTYDSADDCSAELDWMRSLTLKQIKEVLRGSAHMSAGTLYHPVSPEIFRERSLA